MLNQKLWIKLIIQQRIAKNGLKYYGNKYVSIVSNVKNIETKTFDWHIKGWW